MRKKFTVTIIVGVFFALSVIAQIGAVDKIKKATYIRRCEIIDFRGTILKSFPGEICLFLDDGRLVSADLDGMNMYDKEQKKIWHLPGMFHHQINMTSDKKYILALSSKAEGRDKPYRADEFLKIDLNGKVIFRQDSKTIFDKVKYNFDPAWRIPSIPSLNLIEERSHFNSIYEVPANEQSAQALYLKPKNIIINSVKAGIFILSSDMKQVLGHWLITHSFDHSIHDVQVTKEGHFIFLNNRNFDDPLGPYSSVDIWNPSTEKVVYKYTATPRQFFFSAAGGSVQQIDQNTVLFTDHFKGGFFLNKGKKELIAYSPDFNLWPEKKTTPIPVIQIKQRGLDLDFKWTKE